MYTPVKDQLYYIKVEFKRIKIIKACFRDVIPTLQTFLCYPFSAVKVTLSNFISKEKLDNLDGIAFFAKDQFPLKRRKSCTDTVLILSTPKTKSHTFENSADPDEMAHPEPSHQDLHCWLLWF